MTPRERAESAVVNFYSANFWGHDPNQHQELILEIEKQITQAIAHEQKIREKYDAIQIGKAFAAFLGKLPNGMASVILAEAADPSNHPLYGARA